MKYPDEKPNLIKKYDAKQFGLTQANKDMFKKYLKNASCYLEIGSDCGVSARYIAENFNVDIICIDPWKEHNSTRPLPGDAFGKERLQNFIHRTWEYKNRITILNKKSSDGLIDAKEKGLNPDVIYIDGCHQHDCVLLDLFLCDKCFPNAQICGDDYEYASVQNSTSVEKAVLDFCKLHDYDIETFTNITTGRKRCFGVIK